MTYFEKIRVDTSVKANENFDKEPSAAGFPIQLNLWYSKNDELTAKLKATVSGMSKECARFRKDTSKTKYSTMCDIYFKDADSLNKFIKRGMSNIDMVENKVMGSEKKIYPYMLLDAAREIVREGRAGQRA